MSSEAERRAYGPALPWRFTAAELAAQERKKAADRAHLEALWKKFDEIQARKAANRQPRHHGGPADVIGRGADGRLVFDSDIGKALERQAGIS